MDLYEQIFENNKSWVAEKVARNKDYFKNLSEGQSPEIYTLAAAIAG
jgi:carbonic anhydrase